MKISLLLNNTILTLALPFFSDIRMLQNDPTPGLENFAKPRNKQTGTVTPLRLQLGESWCLTGIFLHKWGEIVFVSLNS
jgi:hypothetical protein